MRRRSGQHQSDLIVGVTTVRGGAPGDYLTINSHRRLGSGPGTGGPPRTRLLAATTFYVDATTGSDTNSGLSPIFPKRNIQEMIDDLYLNYDFGGFDVTVQLTSHFIEGFEIDGFFVGQRGAIKVQGNPADVTAVRIDVATIDKCVRMTGGSLLLQDLTVTNTGDGDALYLDAFAFLTLGNFRFENVDGQMMVAGGGSHIFVNAGKTITVAGSGRNFVHHTGKSEVSFEDCALAFIANPGSGLNPRWSVYYLGGNDASVTFNRCVITGDFSGAIVEHFGAFIKNSPTSGNIFPTFYVVGMPSNIVDSGGAIYTIAVQPSTYVGLTGNDLSEGFTAALPVLNFSTTMALMAARYQSNPYTVPPVMQVNDGNYPASIVLLDIPGCPIAYCRGNVATPANCTVRAIQNRAENTQWILDGITFFVAADDNVTGSTGTKTAVQNCVFSGGNNALVVAQNALIEASGPISVTGGGLSFINNNGGNVIIASQTVTFVGTPTYSVATVVGNSGGRTRWTGTKTGAVTGTRVDLKNGAFLDSNNPLDQTSIPGTVDGVIDSGTFALMV